LLSGGESHVRRGVRGVGVGMVEGVEGVGGRDRKLEAHAVPFGDGNQDILRLGVPEKPDVQTVTGAVIELAEGDW